MSSNQQKMSRLQFVLLRRIATHCPWYIRLVAGKYAEEVLRRLHDAEEQFNGH